MREPLNSLKGNGTLPNYGQRKRKEDARELARVIYDIFKENQANGNIDNGQNNAQKDSD